MKAMFAIKLFFYITLLILFALSTFGNFIYTPSFISPKLPPPSTVSATSIIPLPKASPLMLNPITQIHTKPTLNCNGIKLLSNYGYTAEHTQTPHEIMYPINLGANGVQISIEFKNKKWQPTNSLELSDVIQAFNSPISKNNALFLVNPTTTTLPILLRQFMSSTPTLISDSSDILTQISNLGYKGTLSLFINDINYFSKLKVQIKNLKALQGDNLVVRIDIPLVADFKPLIDYLNLLNVRVSLVQAENISLSRQQAIIKSLFQVNKWRPISLIVSRQYNEFCLALKTTYLHQQNFNTDFSSECLVDKRICDLVGFINSVDKSPLWLTPYDFFNLDSESSLKLIDRVKIIDDDLSIIAPINPSSSIRVLSTPMILSFKKILTLSREFYSSGKEQLAYEILKNSIPSPITIQLAVQALRGSISPSPLEDPNKNFTCYLKKLFMINYRDNCTISELDTFIALGGIITQGTESLVISKEGSNKTCFSYHSKKICFDGSDDFIKYDYYKSLFLNANTTNHQPKLPIFAPQGAPAHE